MDLRPGHDHAIIHSLRERDSSVTVSIRMSVHATVVNAKVTNIRTYSESKRENLRDKSQEWIIFRFS